MPGEFDNIETCSKPVRDPLPKVNTLRVDLLGDNGRKFLEEVNKGVSKRYKELMKRHYRFNPENS